MSLCVSSSSFSRLASSGSKANRALLPSRATLTRRAPGVVVRAQGEPEEIDGQKVVKVSDPMSPEFKKRLREEYTGLGGAPNKPMSQNYFLIIILIVAALAILTKLTGNI